MSKKIGIHLGAMADPIWKQLKDQDLKVKSTDCEKYQRAINGLSQLRFLGCLGDKEYERIAQRLAGKILKFADGLAIASPSPNTTNP